MNTTKIREQKDRNLTITLQWLRIIHRQFEGNTVIRFTSSTMTGFIVVSIGSSRILISLRVNGGFYNNHLHLTLWFRKGVGLYK